MLQIANVIGVIGVIFILLTYLLLQIEKLKSDSYTYILGNLCGSSMILFSLLFQWNLSAALVEIAWIAVSFFGLCRRFIYSWKLAREKKSFLEINKLEA